MLKLIAHLAVAVALVFAGRSMGWSWWLVALSVVVGATLVHLAWERLFGGAAGHLGAVPIAADDPLMLEAFEEAKRTWDHFTRLYPEHRERSIVKFRLRTKDGEIENVWGDLLELASDRATVRLLTPPVGDVEMPGDPRRLEVPVADIVDWQIVFPDNTLRGGFTHRATFAIWERYTGNLPSKFRRELERYRDL